MPLLIVAWHSHLVGMSSSLKEAFNLVQSGGAGIVGRAGGSYEAGEGEEGLLGGASHSHYAILCQALPQHCCIVCHTIVKVWQPHSIRCHISIT